MRPRLLLVILCAACLAPQVVSAQTAKARRHFLAVPVTVRGTLTF